MEFIQLKEYPNLERTVSAKQIGRPGLQRLGAKTILSFD